MALFTRNNRLQMNWAKSISSSHSYRSAFDGTQLEEGTTIHEADLEGCYLKEQDRLDARAKDSETEWSSSP